MHCVSIPKPGSPQGWNALQQREEIWKFVLGVPRETRLWGQLQKRSLCPPGFPSVAQKCWLLLLIRAVWKHPRQSWSRSKRAWVVVQNSTANQLPWKIWEGAGELELWHQ